VMDGPEFSHVTDITPAPVGLLRLWFGFRADVTRAKYVATGVGLMIVKYAVEAAALGLLTERFLSPFDFLNPVYSVRQELVRGAPEWLGWAWFFWTLPFLWIAVTMTVRRAVNAGRSPWFCLLILVPIVNLAAMLFLAIAPGRQRFESVPQRDEVAVPVQSFRSAVLGVVVGLGIALTMVGVSVYAFDTYGSSLFLGTPVLMGAVASVISNSVAPRKYSSSISLGMLTVLLAGAGLLAFALEGLICIVMAAPIALPLGGLGGVLGKIIAEVSVRPIQGTMAAMMFLPIWAGVEGFVTPEREFVVTTAVEIDAGIDRVWNGVIHFPELQKPDEWYFRWGIACPMRAEIDGVGVGAVRRCIFTTGTFVEPITSWDKPHRLAFDVVSQPAPMFELTPYADVHPPHLDGGLRSTRGEFVLEEVSPGKTRLLGRTWYRFDMFPHTYWTLWSDLMIHRIHKRVLDHVKFHAERNPPERSAVIPTGPPR
ncbi:MAG: hypothetical protein QF363_04780, partial [Planctomycetaceae bacterium]|nr:hypothetical protein [Planctomycetaceae bacterium]